MADLHIRAIRVGAHDHYSPEHLETWAGPITPEGHGRMVEDPSLQVWVAVDEGQVVGFVSYVPAEQRLSLLYVDPDRFRRGIGTLLTQHVLDVARSLGHQEVLVTASHLSKGVFERCGFVVVEVLEKPMRGLVFECFAMRADLAGAGVRPPSPR